MEIERLNALSDNYIFLLYDRAQKIAAVVDPAEPEPVFRRLEAFTGGFSGYFQYPSPRRPCGG